MNPLPFPEPSPPRVTAPSKGRSLLTIVFMLCLGGMFGAGIAIGSRMLFEADPAAGRSSTFTINIWSALLLPFMFWSCVLVHELGHLLGGWLSGMRPLLLFAGPLQLEFGADSVRPLRNRVVSTWGGLAVCAPRTADGATRFSYSLMVAAGPISSFLLAAVAGFSALAIGGWIGGVLFLTGALSMTIGVGTLMPVRAGGFMSDGGQLLGLIRGDKVTRQRLALGALLGQSYAGVRPRDWNPGLLRAIGEHSSDITLQVTSNAMGASHAEDRGDLDSADRYWRSVAEVLGSEQVGVMAPAVRGSFALGIATWIGHRRREGGSARSWLDGSKGGFAEPASRAYAESAVALAEGDIERARKHLEAARTALPHMNDRGGAVMLAESLDDLSREIDKSSLSN